MNKKRVMKQLPFTVKKRVRKSFAKLGDVMEVPYLLSIQRDSYKEFLQLDCDPESREDKGLHAAFKSIFPIKSNSGHIVLDYISYSLGNSWL